MQQHLKDTLPIRSFKFCYICQGYYECLCYPRYCIVTAWCDYWHWPVIYNIIKHVQMHYYWSIKAVLCVCLLMHDFSFAFVQSFWLYFILRNMFKTKTKYWSNWVVIGRRKKDFLFRANGIKNMSFKMHSSYCLY